MKKRIVILMAAMLMLLPACGQKKEALEDTEEILQIPEEEEKKPQEYDVKLPDKLSEFQFAIDGKVWELPSAMQSWKEEGWECGSDKEETVLEADSYTQGATITKDGRPMKVDFVNLDSEKKKLEECYVGGVRLEYEKEGSTFQLPGKIIMGESTLNDVLKAYGTPTDEYEEKEDIYITYKFGIYKEAEFIFDISSETLKRADLKNYREPENEEEEISKEAPEEVKNYQEPAEFSQNPLDYIISYDDTFYQMPAPVSEFIKNGWEVEEDGSDTYVKAGRHGYVTLEKDGKMLYAVVRNYGEATVEVQNTFVTSVSGDFDVTKVPVTVGDHITLGMSEEDMKIRLGGTTYETKEEEKGTSYTCYSDETKKNYIRLFIDKDLKLIREIQISNSPDTLGGTDENVQVPIDSSVLVDENNLPE